MKAALKLKNPATAEQVSPLKIAHSVNQCLDCRKRKQHGRYCHKHSKRHYRAKHFARYTFNALKQNAKRRKKEFTLTFEQFTEFCNQTGYLVQKGQAPGNYTIDRIDHTQGYTITNIRVLTHAENSRKGYWEKQGYQNEDHYRYEHIEEDPF